MSQKVWNYSYEDKCECSEDDRCGCSYPANMERSYISDKKQASDITSASVSKNLFEQKKTEITTSAHTK